MFSEMIAELHDKGMPEPAALLKRFDFALTKKLGIIKLPPAFWMQDPKINPRSDHLFWAALLLKDRERIDLALSVIAVEQEVQKSRGGECRTGVSCTAGDLIEKLLEQFADEESRQQFYRELRGMVPGLPALTCEKP